MAPATFKRCRSSGEFCTAVTRTAKSIIIPTATCFACAFHAKLLLSYEYHGDVEAAGCVMTVTTNETTMMTHNGHSGHTLRRTAPILRCAGMPGGGCTRRHRKYTENAIRRLGFKQFAAATQNYREW